MHTNIDILGLDRVYYDTNNQEYLTNTFQAVDIDVTNGVNTFIIHATDLAGNVTVTNFSLTVESDSVPPSIALAWPQNQMRICASNFTIVGTVDDISAIITVSYTDSNGNTNTTRGLIERDGTFLFDDLPLPAGTNSILLTAIDPWGNAATTNIMIVQSTFGLAIAQVDTNYLYLPIVTNVTGTISNASYSVWVNGVRGTNHGDGTWSAVNVPITPGSTASFRVSAYPSTDTVSSNLSNPSVNPADTNSENATQDDEKPMRVWVDNYSESDDFTEKDTNYYFLGLFSIAYNNTGDYSMHWQDGQGGAAESTDTTITSSPTETVTLLGNYTQSWPPSFYPDLPAGTVWNDPDNSYDDEDPSPPPIVCQHIAKKDIQAYTIFFTDPTFGPGKEYGMKAGPFPNSADAKIKSHRPAEGQE